MRLINILSVLLLSVLLTGCVMAPPALPTESLPTLLPEASPGAQSTTVRDGAVYLEQVTENIWIHTTLDLVGSQEVPSNGLVVLTEEGAALIDTPWTEAQTAALLETVSERLGSQVTLAVFTHAHRDRVGGIGLLKRQGIETYSLAQTAAEAERNGFEAPGRLLESEQPLPLMGVAAEIYFPGPGHSPDNAVIWFPEERVLFGGCLVKTADAREITAVADSDPEGWLPALQAVRDRYPDIGWVIPGHGSCGGEALLQHTIDLLAQHTDT